MALLGGGVGGAGNPVGGSFTGPAKALEIIGDFAYAYTGLKLASTYQTGLEVLLFTTGNYLFVGDIQLNAEVDDDDPTLGGTTSLMTSFNGVKISLIKADGELERAPSSVIQPVIIPAYTEVSCLIDSGQGGGDTWSSVTITGRIYRS